MTIWKFPLKLELVQKVSMPNHASIRYVDVQNGVICLWAEVNTDRPKVDRVFYIVGTGNILPPNASEYIGSVQMPPFVWHVYGGK